MVARHMLIRVRESLLTMLEKFMIIESAPLTEGVRL
jgi:hypothetical protein